MADETREMNVQIVSITFDTTIKGQARDYPGTEVVYRTEEGKVLTKGMATTTFNFNKQLRVDLEALAPNDYAHVVMIKKGAFVNWQSATKIDAPAKTEPEQAPDKSAAPAKATPPTREAVRSNYETPEERAARQVMIVRQSSLTAALKLAELGLTAGNEYLPDESAIIESAKVFESYVLGKTTTTEEPEVNTPE